MSDYKLRLMAVHAHPDDETISGGSTLVKYQAEGVQTILVTCTNGEEGEIHDPDLVEEEARPRLGEIRKQELARATRIMNLSAVELLGYRDSGMDGTPANEHPESFHQADKREATGKLVKLVRQYRPQVMFSYNSFGGYGHPDHIKAHKIAVAAFDYAANTRRYPEAEFGPAWQPSKFYTTAFPRQNWQQVWEELLRQGKPWPFQREDGPVIDENNPPEFGTPDNEITTLIDVSDYYKVPIQALLEHRTQIDPNSVWMKTRMEFTEILGSTDGFILYKSNVPACRPEHDLFEGLR